MERVTSEIGNKSFASEFTQRIDQSLLRNKASGKFSAIVLLQIANMQGFRSQRPEHVVRSLLRELHHAVRNAVHPDQYVGIFQDGLGLVFDMPDVGQIDILARRLVLFAQNTIRAGRYNDLSSRWSDIIYQFLWPNKPGIIFPCVGWAIAPRDGNTPKDLVKRAFNHILELQR